MPARILDCRMPARADDAPRRSQQPTLSAPLSTATF